MSYNEEKDMKGEDMKKKIVKEVAKKVIWTCNHEKPMLETVKLVGTAVSIGATVMDIGLTVVPKILKHVI